MFTLEFDLELIVDSLYIILGNVNGIVKMWIFYYRSVKIKEIVNDLDGESFNPEYNSTQQLTELKKSMKNVRFMNNLYCGIVLFTGTLLIVTPLLAVGDDVSVNDVITNNTSQSSEKKLIVYMWLPIDYTTPIM